MHEFISIYIVKLADYNDVHSLEDHIEFDWVPLKELKTCGFKPEESIDDILKCVKDNEGFWA